MTRVVRCAQLCQAIYAPVAVGIFDHVFSVSGINVGLKVEDGMIRLAFAGSECTADWVRNFKAVPTYDKRLGIVHAGFLEGMQDIFNAVVDHIRNVLKVTLPLSITGHSLGCAHAGIFAGFAIDAGMRVAELVLFAPPRASYAQLRDILRANIATFLAFRNGFDPVPEVPLSIPLVAPWVHWFDLVQVTAWPADRLNPFDYHALALYAEAIEALYPELQAA